MFLDYHGNPQFSQNFIPTGGPSSIAANNLEDCYIRPLAFLGDGEMGLSAIIVTHDLAVVRLLADRLMVMKSGRVVEAGLTDQVLDDPQHGYTQLLVSSVLQV